jgi:hypothetical protein
MWQRIQTLYLAVSTALLFVLFFSDVYTIATPEGMQYVTYWQIWKPYFGILLVILFAMTAFALISFKVRILQMRLATLSGLVALGMTGWLAYGYFTAPENVTFKWTVIFPLIVAICNFLAARGCFQDQLMVESAYRVREARKRDRKKAKK